jgi:hypothetical protein
MKARLEKEFTMGSAVDILRIDVPSATDEPAAYVDTLLKIAADQDTFAVLPRTPVRARELSAGLSDELIARPPEPGEWSVEQIVGHLFDVDVVYGFRWRLVLTEDSPSYPGYDETRWGQLPRLPFWQSLDAWTGLRAANIVLLRSLQDKDWERVGQHGEQGGETLERMVRKVIGHDLAHLNQIYRAARAVRAEAALPVSELDAAYSAVVAGDAADPTTAGRH